MRYVDWVPEARCRGRDDVDWFGEWASPEALAICGACPVRGKCFTEAIDRHHKDDAGVWAGTTTVDRMRIRRGDYEVWELWAKQGYPYRSGEEVRNDR